MEDRRDSFNLVRVSGVCPVHSHGRNSTPIDFKLGTHDPRRKLGNEFVGQPDRSKDRGTSVFGFVITENIYNTVINVRVDFSMKFRVISPVDCSVLCI